MQTHPAACTDRSAACTAWSCQPLAPRTGRPRSAAPCDCPGCALRTACVVVCKQVNTQLPCTILSSRQPSSSAVIINIITSHHHIAAELFLISALVLRCALLAAVSCESCRQPCNGPAWKRSQTRL